MFFHTASDPKAMLNLLHTHCADMGTSHSRHSLVACAMTVSRSGELRTVSIASVSAVASAIAGAAMVPLGPHLAASPLSSSQL